MKLRLGESQGCSASSPVGPSARSASLTVLAPPVVPPAVRSGPRHSARIRAHGRGALACVARKNYTALGTRRVDLADAAPGGGKWRERMRCVRCGAVLAPESERCPRCGALATVVANAPPFVPDPPGLPVLRFSPAPAAPPVAPDPYVRPERAADDARVHRTLARLRMVLPAPRRRRSRRRLYAGLTLLLAVLVLAAYGAGDLARSGDLILQLRPPPVRGAPHEAEPAHTAIATWPVAPVAV